MRSLRGRPRNEKKSARRGCATCLRSERAAAAAGRFGVRVVEDEPFADQVRVVVEHGAVQKEQALFVDVNLRAGRPLELFISQPRLPLPGKRIAQPGAPATFDADAQSTLVDALLGHQRADLARG